MSKKICFFQKLLTSVWIATSLSCSMSIDEYYISHESYADYAPVINVLLRLCRNLSTNRLLTFCLFLLGWVLITYVWRQKCSRKEKLLSFLFANLFTALQLLGRSYAENNSWDALFCSRFVMLRAFLVYVGVCLAIYYLCLASFFALEYVAARERAGRCTSKQRFWLSVVVILLCWLPYYILLWPGTCNGDTANQIFQFFGYESYQTHLTAWQNSDATITNHHPVLTTLIFGGFTKLGLLLGKAEYGIALYTALQAVVTAIVLEGSLFYLKRFGISGQSLKIGTVFVALFPLFPLCAFNMIKDSFFSVFCLGATLLLVEAVRTNGEVFRKKGYIAALIGSGLLVMLSKSQGIYIMLATAICFLILYRRQWVSVVISLVLPVVFVQFVWLQVLLPMWNIAPAGKQEMLGVLFQQTARYVVEYSEDISAEEEEAIRNVLDYDSLAEVYDPNVQDPVKVTYNQQATKEELSEYYHAWFQGLLKHPDSYIQATLNICAYSFYLDKPSGLFYTSFVNKIDEGSELYVQNAVSPDFLTKVVQPILLFLQRLPAVNLIFSVGAYTWIILYFYLFAIRNGVYRYLPAGLIYFLYVCVFVISPVGGNFRYSRPLVYAMPFLTGAILLVAGCNQGKEKNSCPEQSSGGEPE